MPNSVTSIIIIEPEAAKEKIHSMIHESLSEESDLINLIQRFYPDFDESLVGTTELDQWMFNNLGTSSLSIELDDNLKIETTSWFPDGFLIRLFFSCCDEYDDIKIVCKWKDDSERQCGVAVVSYGFYAEEDTILGSNDIDDVFYYITGEEVIYDVQSWLMMYADKYGDVTKWEVQVLDDDKIRKMFADTKSKLRNSEIEKIWSETYDYCMDAIYLEDYDYLDSRLVKLANKKYDKIEGVYPWK